MIIVPNRRGVWARSDISPFGHGRPYSRPQLSRLLQQAEFEQFEVKQLLAGGARVVALIEIKLLWKPTGRRFADDHAIHVWEFDGHGKVARFTHVEDTHAMWLATVAP